jgi:tetraprenyl-beta-curcumene synthase
VARRPSSLREFRALTSVAARELTWTIPHVERELARWRHRALTIPDPSLRADALETLASEHMNAAGAALFAALPAPRSTALLRSLVAFQVALDYLDTVTERPMPTGAADGYQLHRALVEALDPGGEQSDYYAHRPGPGDGGYLSSLVSTCRRSCATLPGFRLVRASVLEAASNLSVQVINHMPIASERDTALMAWAVDRNAGPELAWFELTAAASSTLGIYALLAAAVDPHLDPLDVTSLDTAYHPWICLACTLMDSFVDQAEDRENVAHNYFTHYPDGRTAAKRLRSIIERALREARNLKSGERHAIVVTGMIAMYLSKQATPDRQIRRDVGWLGQIEIPVTRVMRALLGGQGAARPVDRIPG